MFQGSSHAPELEMGLESESAPDKAKESEKDYLGPAFVAIGSGIVEQLDTHSLAQLARVSQRIYYQTRDTLERVANEARPFQAPAFRLDPYREASRQDFKHGISGIRNLSRSQRLRPLISFALQIGQLGVWKQEEFVEEWLAVYRDVYRDEDLSPDTLHRIATFMKRRKSAYGLLPWVIREGILNRHDLCGWVYVGEKGKSQLFRRHVRDKINEFNQSRPHKIEDAKDLKEWIFATLPDKSTPIDPPEKRGGLQDLQVGGYEDERDWLGCASALSTLLNLDMYSLHELDPCRLAIHVCLAGGHHPSDEDICMMPFRNNIEAMVQDVIKQWEETPGSLWDIAEASLPGFMHMNFMHMIDIEQLGCRFASGSLEYNNLDSKTMSKIIDTKDEEGRTTLHAALDAKQSAFAKWLVGNGSDLTALTHDGRSPLCVAAQVGDYDCVRIILDKVEDESVKLKLVRQATYHLVPSATEEECMDLLLSILKY